MKVQLFDQKKHNRANYEPQLRVKQVNWEIFHKKAGMCSAISLTLFEDMVSPSFA